MDKEKLKSHVVDLVDVDRADALYVASGVGAGIKVHHADGAVLAECAQYGQAHMMVATDGVCRWAA